MSSLDEKIHSYISVVGAPRDKNFCPSCPQRGSNKKDQCNAKCSSSGYTNQEFTTSTSPPAFPTPTPPNNKPVSENSVHTTPSAIPAASGATQDSTIGEPSASYSSYPRSTLSSDSRTAATASQEQYSSTTQISDQSSASSESQYLTMSSATATMSTLNTSSKTPGITAAPSLSVTSAPLEFDTTTRQVINAPPPTLSGSAVLSTGAITLPAATTSAAASSATNQSLSGARLAAILVPIVVTLAALPLLYLWYLRWRNKRQDREIQEQNIPPESRLLQPRSSRHNSLTSPLPFVEPFSDNERGRTDSVGMSDRPTGLSPRYPSFILPSNTPPGRTTESWPLTSVLLPDPPPAYDPVPTSLRPPSSRHGRSSTRTQSSDVGDFAASNGVRMPFNQSRASDAVSELSFERTSLAERPREADELSVVSALDEEDAEKDPQHLV